MTTLLKNGNVLTLSGFEKKDLLVVDKLVFLSPFDKLESEGTLDFSLIDNVIDCDNKYIVPGFVDVHVHLREPGFSYKETIKTGTMAGAAGGYSLLCSMPNVNPSPADMERLNAQLDVIKEDAVIRVVPYGTITSRGDGRSQLSDMEKMAPYVIAFSDDGKGVQANHLMEDAMIKAKSLGKAIVAHCEDESLLDGGYIHKGEYAQAHGHKGICSESEWVQVKRDVELAKKTGCKYHVCHVSTKESVEIIRQAKARGVDVTCETAPHYLILSDLDLKEEGRFKMNPPIRGKEDRAALIEGIIDGTVDMIATDHAPHSEDEKSRGLEKSPFGIVGLEIAFPLLYTHLVKKGIITLEKLVDLMTGAPVRRFDLVGSKTGRVTEGMIADLAVIDLEEDNLVDPSKFYSLGKATPFQGDTLKSKISMTMVNGKIVYKTD